MITPSDKNTLLNIALALYENKQKHADALMQECPKCKGIQGTTIEKIAAVEQLLKVEFAKDASQAYAKDIIPDNAIHSGYGFYDEGFDFRFPFEGRYYLPPSTSFCDIITRIVEIFNYVIFWCNTHLSSNEEQKNFRRLVLDCASIESNWFKDTYDAEVKFDRREVVYRMFAMEHAFYEKVGQLFKTTVHEGPQRPFPSEVVQPIHNMNNPQSNFQRAMYSAPGYLNCGDLAANCSGYAGFERLNSNWLRLEKTDYELGVVPHYIFFHAVHQSSDALKEAVRTLRETFQTTVVDYTSATNIQACRDKILPVLNAFKNAWDGYIHSHIILTEAQVVYSEKDHYASKYKLYTEQYADLSIKCELITQVREEGEMSVHEAFKTHPSLITTQFLQRHNKFATK